jgi:23S rRNA pseudouridine955/2504/2580 synthase
VRLPIAADNVYGGKPVFLSRLKSDYRPRLDRPERPLIATTALHAERLSLRHPVTGAEISITAEWSKDLRVVVRYLQRYAATQANPLAMPNDVADDSSMV